MALPPDKSFLMNFRWSGCGGSALQCGCHPAGVHDRRAPVRAGSSTIPLILTMAVAQCDQRLRRKSESNFGTSVRGQIPLQNGMSPLRQEKSSMNARKRKQSPNESGDQVRIVKGQFDDAIERPRFLAQPMHGTDSLRHPYYQPGHSNPLQMSEFSQESQARSIAPVVPGGYLLGVTIPPFRNSPQIHLRPLLPKATAIMGIASSNSAGTSQNTTNDTRLSALLRVPQQYCPRRLPHAQSTTTRDNLHGPSNVRASHDPNCGDRSMLPSSGVPQYHQATRLPQQQPRASLPTTSAIDDPQGANPSPSNHGPEPDAPQSSNPIPLPQNDQNRTLLQHAANSRQYAPLAPQWSPAFPFGIPMPPPSNPPRVVPNANDPTTPFQRALNRAGAQLASRNVEMNVREDKDKKFGIADNELTYADVLYGRGSWTNSHPGNVFFRALVDEYRMEYATAGRGRKTSVSKNVVRLIRNNHGRFLKKDEDDDLWFEVGDQKAIEKTGQTLREGMAKVVRESLVSHVAIQARNGNFPFAANAPNGAENNQE